MRGMSKKRTRVAAPGSAAQLARRCRRALTPSRSATASVASSSTASGSRQSGRLWAMSPPTMKVSSSRGSSSCNALRVSTVKDGPARSSLDARDAEPLVARDREPAQRQRGAATPGSASTSLCGGACDRHEQHAVEPELDERLLRADQVADVRRVERPAEEADPHALRAGPGRRPRPGT